jgi:hydroxyacylglutathione hydrolase
MNFQRFEVPGLAHYSYLIGDDGRAAVIDPRRDVDIYVEYAAANDLRISHVLETHIHADYASGARELAEAAGAELLLSGHDRIQDFQYRFPHHAVRDGEELRLGDARIKALHTPGHTPEHLSFLLYDAQSGAEPVALFSGDFVFVGSLGRPDLLGEAAKKKLAESLYESLQTKIAGLPDGVKIYPGHGAGSMCGSGMASDRAQSTLGYERKFNPFFLEADKAAFVARILKNVPPFPDYYRRMKRVNSEGPKILRGLPGNAPLALGEFRSLLGGGGDGAVVIDLRRPEAFGAGHIPGAFSIGVGSGLSTWAAWVVQYDRPILLAGDDSTSCEDAIRSLIRVGLDDVRGYLAGGMSTWSGAGLEQAQIPQLSVVEMHERSRKGAYLLDVRADGEWQAGHVESATHIMGGDLPKRIAELPRDSAIHVVCGTGYRSSVASSVLARAGFRNLFNVTGGMTAWNEQKLPAVRESA